MYGLPVASYAVYEPVPSLPTETVFATLATDPEPSATASLADA
ncbi:hypothetical protein BSU04_00020 [Caballeronia sordidicola]|uniref:Uncharacterized protein n=1 Tax=Caballeronia sordidicola TaxID=196367 RepID=A0A226XBC5_CABSO|nr:hypothetical protein BSU04_38975 [Caballeronia sordidicola]OXC80741.1 hypothetical protein BSU04_00020 [Caballeronia sordidicola]